MEEAGFHGVLLGLARRDCSGEVVVVAVVVGV
jgi:hypothetical protein